MSHKHYMLAEHELKKLERFLGPVSTLTGQPE